MVVALQHGLGITIGADDCNTFVPGAVKRKNAVIFQQNQ